MSGEDSHSHESCPECSSSRILEDKVRGEIYCGSCGLVLTERISEELPKIETDEATELPKFSYNPRTITIPQHS